MQHDIRSELQGVLINRRGEGVVHHHQCADFFRGGGQTFNVDNLDGRVGRRFQVEHLTAFGNLHFYLCIVGGIA